MAVKKKSQKKSAQKKSAAKKAVKKKAAKKKAAKKAAASPAKPKGPIRQRASFRLNEYIVYPAHGVGQIIEIKEQRVSDLSMEFFRDRFQTRAACS